MIKIDDEWVYNREDERIPYSVPLHHIKCLNNESKGWTSDFNNCDDCKVSVPKDVLRKVLFITNNLDSPLKEYYEKTK